MLHHRCAGLRIALLIVAVSCTGDDINLTCPDPLGADAQIVQVYKLSCFESEFSGCFEFRLRGDSVYIQSIYVPYPDPDPSEAPTIVDAGAATCLSEVMQHPQGGWSYAVWATQRHGYVFRMKDGSLGRLYIDSWNTSTDTVEVSYTRQYPF